MTNATLQTISYDTQDCTVLKYSSLVNQAASHLMSRLPPCVDIDDLIQAGMIGLLEASKNYDPSRGASFETYAKIRIRGAMLDEVRKGDWAPRSLYRKVRQMTLAVEEVEAQHKRHARGEEIADQMRIELSEYHRLLQQEAEHRILSLEDIPSEDECSAEDTLPTPEVQFETHRVERALAEEITALPEKEALVIALYYDEELNMREIGEILGITESRVCQLRSQALIHLRARMSHWLS